MRTRTRTVISVALAACLVALFLVGQSTAGGTTTLGASLTGADEVPGPGDPDGSGAAVVMLNPAQGRVCFELDWTKIGSPFAAHIHRAPVGVAGPVRVTFFQANRHLPGTITGVDGCVRNVDPTLIQTIIDNPQKYYVNIHNTTYPGGALRGQLS